MFMIFCWAHTMTQWEQYLNMLFMNSVIMGETVQRIFTGSIYNLIVKVSSALFGFLSVTYIIRNYSVAEYGIYTLAMSLVTLAGITTSFGMPGMLERYSPEFYAKKDFGCLRKLFFAAVVLRLLLSMLFMVLI